MAGGKKGNDDVEYIDITMLTLVQIMCLESTTPFTITMPIFFAKTDTIVLIVWKK